MRHPRAFLAAAAAATCAALGAPAGAFAAPISLVSVTPKAVPTQGIATVVFKITGGAVDATSSLVIRGTELQASTISHEVESLSIVSAGLSGQGRLAVALPPLAGYPPSCERGGIHPASSVSAYTLTIPARVVTALVVRVKVPQGFASQTPAVEVTSTPLLQTGTVASTGTKKNDVVSAPVPRTGPGLDGVEMSVSASASDPGAYVAKGRVVPARGGAMIRIVGARTGDEPVAPAANLVAQQTLGQFADAMAPLGSGLDAYAKTKTNDAGRFAVRFSAPLGTVVVARSRGIGGTTAAGASCPVQLGH